MGVGGLGGWGGALNGGDSFDLLSKKPLVLLTLLKLFPRSFEVLLPNPEPHLDRHRLKFSIIVTIATEVLKYRSESLAGTIYSDNICSPVEHACMSLSGSP